MMNEAEIKEYEKQLVQEYYRKEILQETIKRNIKDRAESDVERMKDMKEIMDRKHEPHAGGEYVMVYVVLVILAVLLAFIVLLICYGICKGVKAMLKIRKRRQVSPLRKRTEDTVIEMEGAIPEKIETSRTTHHDIESRLPDLSREVYCNYMVECEVGRPDYHQARKKGRKFQARAAVTAGGDFGSSSDAKDVPGLDPSSLRSQGLAHQGHNVQKASVMRSMNEPPSEAKVESVCSLVKPTSVTDDGDFGSSSSSEETVDLSSGEQSASTKDAYNSSCPDKGIQIFTPPKWDWESLVNENTSTSDEEEMPAFRTCGDLSEGDVEDATNTQDTGSSMQRKKTLFRCDTDYIQAEGSPERVRILKKLENFVLVPTHRVTTRRTDAMLAPGIFSTVVESLLDLVSSSISPDGSKTSLEEPDGPPKLNLGEFEYSDQDTTKEERNRLTEPKNPGVLSILDFCQAEGSPHSENEVVFGQEKTIILDDPTGNEPDKGKSTERPTTPSTLESQTHGSPVTQAKPVPNRHNISIDGVPICTVVLNTKCVPRLDANMNEVRVYDMRTDEDETTSPPEENRASNSAPADAATGTSTADQVIVTAGSSATPGETAWIPVSGGEDNKSLKQIPMQPMDKNESHEPDEVNILIAQVKTTNNGYSLEHSASQMPMPTSHKVKKNKHQGSTASETCSCCPAEHVFTLPANWESLADENISTSDEEDLRTFQTGGFQYSPFPDLDLSAVSAVQFNAKPLDDQGQNVEKASPSSVKVEIVTIEAKAEKGSEDEALEPPATPDTELTSVTNNGEAVSSSSSDSNCTVTLNPKYVHPLDDNMNEAAVDLKTADETPNPLEENVTSNSVPTDAVTDSASTEQIAATVGPSATPAAQGATDRKKKLKISTGLQETLEGEFEHTTETPEKATIDQQGQKIFRTDYMQAEGGGVREKFGNYVLTPTHRVTTRRTDAMLGPSIFSTILEPLNDLVSSLSPDGRGTSLEEPDGSPKLNFGEVKDSDEENKKYDINCLTKPKNPGSCEAEGVQYFKHDDANESEGVLEHNAAVQAVLRDEPPEMGIQTGLFFTMSSIMKKRGEEMEPDPGTQKQNEIGTSAAEELRNTDKEPQE